MKQNNCQFFLRSAFFVKKLDPAGLSTTPRITRVIFSAGYEWDVRFVFGLCDRSWRLLVLIAHSAQKADTSAPPVV